MDLAERAICEYVSVTHLLRSSIGPSAFPTVVSYGVVKEQLTL